MNAPLPNWCHRINNQFLRYIESEYALLTMCKRSLSNAARVVQLEEAFVNLGKVFEEERLFDASALKRLDQTQRDAAFAGRELETDFPLLNAHFTVSAWGTLEVFVEDFLVAWLLNNPATLQKKEFTSVRISLGEYILRQPEEQMRYLLREVAEHAKPKRVGVESFEAIMEMVGLSSDLGVLHATTRRDLIEMYQVRNVLVHRGATADTKIVDMCEWMGLAVGDRVIVTSKQAHRYFYQTTRYLFTIMHRVLRHEGHDPAAHGLELEKLWPCGFEPQNAVA